MMLEPIIFQVKPKKLIGLNTETSASSGRTFEMWSRFMSQLRDVQNRKGAEFYSIQMYPAGLKMKDFTPDTNYVTWSAVEVSDFENAPVLMKKFALRGGLYAVFRYRGTQATFQKTFEYIFLEWLPKSSYELDAREHFEILGEKYLGPNNPDSEEDIYIPVKERVG